MAITIQMQFESAITEANKECFTRSYVEDKVTIIEFDLRKRNYQTLFNTTEKINWRSESYHVDINEISTLHAPIKYRFIISQGFYSVGISERRYFTPEVLEASTAQHMSNCIIRLCCYLAVICGVSLRNIASIMSVMFLVPVTKSTINRWIDEIGNNLPDEETMFKKLVEIKKPTECNIDGYYPLGTDNCVMVVKDEFDRILMTHESKTENFDDAKSFLQRLKDLGLDIKVAYSDYSESFIKAIKEVFPTARFQADHFHTVKNIWKHLKQALLEYRRDIKQQGEEQNDENLIEIAKKLWDARWSLLKKPINLNAEEKIVINDLENIEDGFISGFRSIIRSIVNIFDHSNSEVQAQIKFKNLRSEIEMMKNKKLNKITKFFEDHWGEAMQYLQKRGLSKYPRASNSESGMRLLRRMERNHDGIRSPTTRKHYIKIYQAIKYLSIDVSNFIQNGFTSGASQHCEDSPTSADV